MYCEPAIPSLGSTDCNIESFRTPSHPYIVSV
jgi:hypothetical protein